MSPLTRKSRIADSIHDKILGLGGLILLTMAGIILAGVVARYILNSPIPGVTELIGEGLMVALIYLSLSSAHHIRVSLIINRLSGRARKVVDFFVVGLCAAVLLIGIWPSAEKAIGAYRSGEATTGLITFNLWPYRAVIVLGIALTAARAIERGRRWLEADESGMRAEPELEQEGLVDGAAPPDQHV